MQDRSNSPSQPMNDRLQPFLDYLAATPVKALLNAEHGEPLSLGEAAAMADAMGMTYGQYSLMLSKQKRNVAIK